MIIRIGQSAWVELSLVALFEGIKQPGGSGYKLHIGNHATFVMAYQNQNCAIEKLAIEQIEDFLSPSRPTGVAYLKELIGDMTQTEVSRNTGVGQSILSQILNSKMGMSDSVKLQLAKYFNVQPKDFD